MIKNERIRCIKHYNISTNQYILNDQYKYKKKPYIQVLLNGYEESIK